MTFTIRPYQDSDFEAVYAVWQAALGASWPITVDFFRPYIQAGDRLVTERDGQVVGFAMTQNNAAHHEGTISLVMVRPENQRQGIGRQLQTAAVESLRAQGVVEIQLGHGPFWPGVPVDLPAAVGFFKTCGWVFQDTNYDLAQDLSAYQTPLGILERVAEQGIEFRLASQADVGAILELEDRVFSYWAEFFHITANAGHYDKILGAWDGDTAVGALLLEAGPNHWHQLLGDDMGTIGCVGVDDAYQGRGIGVAMTARASEILKAKGVRQCHVGWTDLLTFYGRLGYRVWRTFALTDEP